MVYSNTVVYGGRGGKEQLLWLNLLHHITNTDFEVETLSTNSLKWGIQMKRSDATFDLSTMFSIDSKVCKQSGDTRYIYHYLCYILLRIFYIYIIITCNHYLLY